MIKLNLSASNKPQERIKEYLENNVSEVLAEKINNGVKITKENKTLINKKDLNGFWKYATEEAKKQAEKGSNGAYVDDETVFNWAIHYFEEDSIEGTLFNEDGSEFKKEIKVSTPPTTYVPKVETKPKDTQTSLFDLMQTETNEEEVIEEKVEEVIEEQTIEETTTPPIIDKETGEVLTDEQINKSFHKQTMFILYNILDGEMEMR